MVSQAVAAVVLLAGIYTVPALAAEAPAAEVAAPQEVVVSPEVEQALRDRVKGRWDALIGGDMEKAYSFETPQYRDQRTLEEYKSEFGGFIMWHKAAIEKVSFVTPETASVRVAVDATMFPPSGGPDIQTVTYLDETWMKVDDQWWYASK